MFGSILWYLRDFINRAAVTEWMSGIPLLKIFKFDAVCVTIINEGTIIILVIIVIRVFKLSSLVLFDADPNYILL
jgi:hypothetical protein